MPANLTPQYKDAERRFRQATSPEEQEKALGEMLAQIPKHKGTEKLQADIKRRLAQLRKEKAKPSAISRQRPIYVIDIEGAGQVPVLGAPNSGKSALIAAVSNAHVQVGDYPYTTQRPAPAMMPFENIQVQLIDTPPASSEFSPPWLRELVRRADALVLVADLSVPDCWEAPAFILEQLEESGIQLVGARIDRIGEGGGDRSLVAGSSDGEERRGGDGNGHDQGGAADLDDDDESLTFRLPAILVGMKSDANEAPQRIEELREYFGDRFPIVAVSIADSESLERFRRVAFEALHVVRVYSKEPGKAAERAKPWLLQEGSTVHDLANAIHHELATDFRYGRLWGSSRFEGQRVGEDYVLRDEDIV